MRDYLRHLSWRYLPLDLAIISVLVFVLLAGCASIGLAPAKSFNERYAYARQETIAVRESCTASLDARLITSADNAYCIKVADQSSELLTLARQAHDIGDLANADSRLALVSGVLAQIQAYLQARLNGRASDR